MKKIVTLVIFLVFFNLLFSQNSILQKTDSLLAIGNYQSALLLLQNQPEDVSILEKAADIYQQIGNYNASINLFTSILEQGENPFVKTKLAKNYSNSGNRKMAIVLYEELFQENTENLLLANTLGKLYILEKQPVKADSIFHYLRLKDSLNPNYPYQIAQTLKMRKKNFKMANYYLEAYNLDSLHANSIYELAKFYKNEMHDKDSSMMFIEKGLQIDSLNVNFLQLKGNALYLDKEFKNALTVLKKLEDLNYKSLNTYEMFGMCHFNLEQMDTAKSYFKKALRLEQNNPKILYRLANVAYSEEDFKLAKLYLSMSILYSKPELDKQYYLMGVISKEELELKLAVEFFEKAHKNNPDNLNALFELAFASDAYFKDQKIAFRYYQKFVAQCKDTNSKLVEYANERIRNIRKQYFIEGEIVE